LPRHLLHLGPVQKWRIGREKRKALQEKIASIQISFGQGLSNRLADSGLRRNDAAD
jgi:hypothetical protein